MPAVSVHLDAVLCHYTNQRVVQIDGRQLSENCTVASLLERLNIPGGMVGHVVCGGRLLESGDPVPKSGTLNLFGIYDGG